MSWIFHDPSPRHQGSRSPQRHVPRLRRAQGPGAGGQRGTQRSTEALLGQAPAAVAEGDVEPPVFFAPWRRKIWENNMVNIWLIILYITHINSNH